MDTTDTFSVLTLPRPAAEVDPGAVVVSSADCDLTYAELDRWSNRLARLLLRMGVAAGTRVAIAIEQEVESVVAERAAVKLGATPVLVAGDGSYVLGTAVGVTTRELRPELSDAVRWLVLDERSTLQRYLTSSDAPLRDAELHPLPVSA